MNGFILLHFLDPFFDIMKDLEISESPIQRLL